MSRPPDLVQGTLDLLILKMLALQPMNGWDISQRLKHHSKDHSPCERWIAFLPPALHQLEQEGWITAEWAPEREQPPRVKFLLAHAALTYKQLRSGTRELGTAFRGDLDMVVRLKEAVSLCGSSAGGTLPLRIRSLFRRITPSSVARRRDRRSHRTTRQRRTSRTG